MPPSPIPAPLPKWAKWALRAAPFVETFLDDLIDYFAQQPDGGEWRRLVIRWHYTGTAGVAQDDIYATFDIVNITNGNIDDTWTTTDYTDCEGAFATMITAINSHIPNCYTNSEFRWYKRAFNTYSHSLPFATMGPPDRILSRAVVGGTPNAIPTQCAMTVTEKTPWPKHWGRFYLPVSGGSDFTSARRFDPAAVDAICTAVATCYATLMGKELFPVVPVTQVNKTAARGLLGVTQVQVDDVPDVVRRRRLGQTAYRKVLSP